MTTTVHRNLTGADLHEPKGASTALAGQIYVSNGAGSGAWVSASSVIASSAWNTGDIKPSHNFVAPSGWIIWIDGTIGDGSSGASIRANADTQALFTLYWGYTSANTTVSGGRGVSAAADYAAHKTVTVPKVSGRVLGVGGNGSGLTSRISGDTVGEETHTLTLSELPGGINSSGGGLTVAVSGTSDQTDVIRKGSATFGGNFTQTGGFGVGFLTAVPTVSSVTMTSTGSTSSVNVASNNTGGLSHNNMQPTAFINMMIKL